MSPRLGIRENAAQFALLVAINALVGATIGLERSLLPALADEVFGLVASTATLSFIAVFGLSKAITNLFAGWLSDRLGRKLVLVAGWLVALPFPLILAWAPSWGWVLAANALLGVSQGLTWSTTVIMKIDLAGPTRRGLAMGINEFAGYLAVALSAALTAWLASVTHLRPEPFVLGAAFVVTGLGGSALFVRETSRHASVEGVGRTEARSGQDILWLVSVRDPTLSAASQAGLVNNLNDGMAWGLFPILQAGAGLDLGAIGVLAATYPAVWGLAQLATGPLSDRVGRRPLIVAGMWVQAAGIVVVMAASSFTWFAAGNVLLGLGTAMVYPTLLAAVADVAHPSWRASAVGVYRWWRDLGYAVGALLAGVLADLLGLSAAIGVVAGLTFASGVVVAVRMRDTRPAPGAARDDSPDAAMGGGASGDRAARRGTGPGAPAAGPSGIGDPVPNVLG
ncbi:MAG: MFS transporter [Myxococcales bacterium]|nr:MFS transporter [Myxococcales bacterium]